MNTNRPTFANIDLSALEHNYRAIRERIGPDVGMMAIVKANAYGHGAVPIASNLERLGADAFGVAFAEEGIELREGGITRPIVVLGGLYFGETGKAVKYGLTPVVHSLENARSLALQAAELGVRLDVHVKIDTGMNRIGLRAPDCVDEVLHIAALGSLRVQGLLSHLATVEPDFGGPGKNQHELFIETIGLLAERGLTPPLVHMDNSMGVMAAPHERFVMVRPGLSLYGAWADPAFVGSMDLRPVMSLTTEIVHLKTVPPGSPISYGGTFVTKRESRIATIPMGYADGLPRNLGNRGEALVRGRRAPIAGAVCMDMAMLDVSDVPDVRRGDRAVLIGSQGDQRITADDWARALDTISYEVFCNIGSRVSRLYVQSDSAEL
ncbi:MAG: alanine racemase [Candidatus Alcyoniella australis]|nr:alanine racemase [Candidatus Alcyoniella australis]